MRLAARTGLRQAFIAGERVEGHMGCPHALPERMDQVAEPAGEDTRAGQGGEKLGQHLLGSPIHKGKMGEQPLQLGVCRECRADLFRGGQGAGAIRGEAEDAGVADLAIDEVLGGDGFFLHQGEQGGLKVLEDGVAERIVRFLPFVEEMLDVQQDQAVDVAHCPGLQPLGQGVEPPRDGEVEDVKDDVCGSVAQVERVVPGGEFLVAEIGGRLVEHLGLVQPPAQGLSQRRQTTVELGRIETALVVLADVLGEAAHASSRRFASMISRKRPRIGPRYSCSSRPTRRG